MSEPEIKRGPGRPRAEGPVQAGDSLTTDAATERGSDISSLTEDIHRIRASRKPFGAFQQKLALPVHANYNRYWFNDVAGRIDEAKESGWTHVLDKDKKPVRRVVGTGRDNGALYAFAMEIPSVFWNEDMEARHAAASSKIEEVKKSPARSRPGEAKASDAGKFYSPQEGVDPVQVVKS